MPKDEKENIQQIIAEGIANAMKPVYYTISGIMLTVLVIFVSVAWPLSEKVSTNQQATVLKINSDEAYANFITKAQYNFLQKEDQRFTTEAILNPKLVYEIFRASAASRAEQLEIRYRGSE